MASKYKNKPTKPYRSQLEVYCASKLKEANISFYYEPIKIPLQLGFEYSPASWEKIGGKTKKFILQRKKVPAIGYIPDFVSADNLKDVKWIVETKGYFTSVARIKWKLLKHWITENKLNWGLFLPSNKKEVNKVIEIILQKYG